MVPTDCRLNARSHEGPRGSSTRHAANAPCRRKSRHARASLSGWGTRNGAWAIPFDALRGRHRALISFGSRLKPSADFPITRFSKTDRCWLETRLMGDAR
ncbi:hypothetical protein BaRGS_00025748 [Batillaria attramentaria]|uniref:Uncharacterized protein n=1 Tax=Batillaria attramentaria TaxID=370345 RepID=A0ABD0K7P1_9CAEN